MLWVPTILLLFVSLEKPIVGRNDQNDNHENKKLELLQAFLLFYLRGNLPNEKSVTTLTSLLRL